MLAAERHVERDADSADHRPPQSHSQYSSRRPTAIGVRASVLLVALTATAIAQGGFWPAGRLPLVVGLSIAVTLAFGRTARNGLGPLHPVLVAAATLAGWAIATATEPSQAVGYVATMATFGGAVVAVGALSKNERRSLVTGLGSLGTLIAATGIVGVAFHLFPWGIKEPGGWRGASVLTYTNATAGILVVLLLLTWWTIHGRGWAVAQAVMATGLFATMSRAGVATLVLGILVACCTESRRPFRLLRQIVATLAGGTIGTVALIPSMVSDSPRPALAVAGLVVGLGVATALVGASWRVITIAMLALVGASFVIANLDPIASRITTPQNDRADLTRLAAREIGRAPLTGVGPGEMDMKWREGGLLKRARYIHNEYLQTTAELGIVGLLIVGLMAVASFSAVYHSSVPLRPALLGASSAIAVHALVDFTWHIPLLVAVAGIVVGLSSDPHKLMRANAKETS